MNSQVLRELILYVIWKAADLDGFTTTLRLHKFLYLIDLEHFRRHGRQFTPLNWTYFHHGPYSPDLPTMGRALGYNLEIETVPTKAGHEANVYRVPHARDFPSDLRFADRVLVEGLLKVWAVQPTDVMLKYVYDSEPVALGEQYKHLAWDEVRRGSRYVKFALPDSPDFRRRLRESIGTYGSNTPDPSAELGYEPCGHEYDRAVAELEDSDKFPDMSGYTLDIPDSRLADYLPEDQR